jgi:hypothetical protein
MFIPDNIYTAENINKYTDRYMSDKHLHCWKHTQGTDRRCHRKIYTADKNTGRQIYLYTAGHMHK